MSRILCAVLGLVLIAPLAAAQSVQVSNWRTISSLRTVRDAADAPDQTLWVATSGGVFSLDQATGNVVEYRNINALQSLDATAITVDPATGTVIVGGGDGALDIRQSDGSWSNITDIRRAGQYPRRGIRDLQSLDGTVYIATDFGVVTFDLDRQVFIETIDRIGTLQEKTRVNGITVLRDSIWVATDSGVAVAPLDVPTLRLPEVWRVMDTTDGLADVTVPFIASNGSEIAVATTSAVSIWNGEEWVRQFETPDQINGLSFSAQLRVSTLDGIRQSNGLQNIPWSGALLGHTTVERNGTDIVIAYVYQSAIQIFDGTSVTPIEVNTPLSNQFARMAIDVNGGFWAATDVDPPQAGQGVSYFADGQWRNFIAGTDPAFASNACYRVSAFPDGRVVIGTWGGGMISADISSGEPVFTRFTAQNSALSGIASNENYVLAADAAMDRTGNVWVVNEQSAGPLLVNTKTGDPSASDGFPNCRNTNDKLYRALAVDLGNTKWVGSFNGAGLLAYNDRGTPDRGDDVCQLVTSANTQLPDNVISVLRTDKVGQIWIGTAKGVAVMAAPTVVSNTTIPFVRRISALTSVVVNDIHVDALNYKWIATTSGVFVLNEDGTEVLAEITTSNAPLADGNVRSIVLDDRTGEVYLGTSFGCSVAQSSSIQPEQTFDLSVRPQPFSVDRDRELIIDGLAADADIRILTVGGFLVRALQARGRQALWDGRDVQGRPVPPGVYLVQSSSATAGTSGVGKIMVTR